MYLIARACQVISRCFGPFSGISRCRVVLSQRARPDPASPRSDGGPRSDGIRFPVRPLLPAFAPRGCPLPAGAPFPGTTAVPAPSARALIDTVRSGWPRCERRSVTRADSKITWRKWLMRRIWYSLGYRILREGRILRHNPPGRVPEGIAVLNEAHEANTGSTRWTSVVGPGYEVDPVHPGPPINRKARIRHANCGHNRRRCGVMATLGAMRNSRHSGGSGTEPEPRNPSETRRGVGADRGCQGRDPALVSLSTSPSRTAAVGSAVPRGGAELRYVEPWEGSEQGELLGRPGGPGGRGVLAGRGDLGG
jgi:hypothetical protein